MRSSVLVLTGLSALSAAPSALAASATGQFNVTLTITKQCTIVAPGSIALGSFGAADLVTTTASASQSYTVNCTKSTPYTIGFSSANDASGGGGVHQMRGTGQNADVVQYSLFDASSNGTVPLDAASHVVSDTGTGTSQVKSLKAQVVNYTATVTPDTYTDTVTMTITY